MPTKKIAPKKAAPKTTSSKPVVKKTGSVKATKVKKDLVYAANETSFWTSDGQVLNSLLALRDAFASMEKAVFAHHVTKEKNDFAAWVDEVLGDAACAAALCKVKTPQSAKTVVVRYLKTYAV